jgi:hypothetical protein
VAEAYIEIIGLLGVELSIPKSVVPTLGYRSAEFASKLVINGVNIRPLPIGLLFLKDITSLILLFKVILEYAFEHSVTHIIILMESLRGVHAPEKGKSIEPSLSRSFLVIILKTATNGLVTVNRFLTLLGYTLGMFIYHNLIINKTTGKKIEVPSLGKLYTEL